jgi:hypothetical protein
VLKLKRPAFRGGQADAGWAAGHQADEGTSFRILARASAGIRRRTSDLPSTHGACR